jgi:hypothetical protein
MNWVDRAADQIEQEYEDGFISLQEVYSQLDDLKGEARQDAAESVYNDRMGW